MTVPVEGGFIVPNSGSEDESDDAPAVGSTKPAKQASWKQGEKRLSRRAALSAKTKRHGGEAEDVGGFKERYYGLKFAKSASDKAFVDDICHNYVKGKHHNRDCEAWVPFTHHKESLAHCNSSFLCVFFFFFTGLSWVMQYYYQGCVSWTWFYPYHYAPFASDFGTLHGAVDNAFAAGTGPVRPLEQLMSVFPPASASFLPASWAHLMTASDSPLAPYYPTDFVTDLNGKRHAWQGKRHRGEPGRVWRTIRRTSCLLVNGCQMKFGPLASYLSHTHFESILIFLSFFSQ